MRLRINPLLVAVGIGIILLVILALLLQPPPKPKNETQPTIGYGPLAQPTSLPAATVLPTLTSQNPTLTRSPTRSDLSDRYGIIITGQDKATTPEKLAAIQYAVDTVGARWWYHYGAPLPEVEKSQQVQLVRVSGKGTLSPEYKKTLEEKLAAITSQSPVYWMIGNEPNTPGQDDVTPELYAEALEVAQSLIHTRRPGDFLVGPNVLNWNYTCNGCPGFTPGQVWVEQMRKAYLSRTGREVPLDIWSIHTYSLDWNQLPLVNQKRDAAQLEAFRGYLDSGTSEKGKPIWLTEFGVIWGYDQLEWSKDEKGNNRANPAGSFRQDLLSSYLTDTLGWLETNALKLNIGRWFIYTSYGQPENFSSTFNGLALFEGAQVGTPLSSFGKIYRSFLTGNPNP